MRVWLFLFLVFCVWVIKGLHPLYGQGKYLRLVGFRSGQEVQFYQNYLLRALKGQAKLKVVQETSEWLLFELNPRQDRAKLQSVLPADWRLSAEPTGETWRLLAKWQPELFQNFVSLLPQFPPEEYSAPLFHLGITDMVYVQLKPNFHPFQANLVNDQYKLVGRLDNRAQPNFYRLEAKKPRNLWVVHVTSLQSTIFFPALKVYDENLSPVGQLPLSRKPETKTFQVQFPKPVRGFYFQIYDYYGKALREAGRITPYSYLVHWQSSAD